MNELSEEIKQDPILEHFFKHLYPGKRIKELYETVFQTDSEKAIARYKFMETKCVPDGTVDSYEYLQDLMRTVTFDTSHLTETQDKPPTIVEVDGQPIKEYKIKPLLGNFYNPYTKAGHVLKAEADGVIQFYINNYPYTPTGGKKEFAYVYTYDRGGKNEFSPWGRLYHALEFFSYGESVPLEPAVAEAKAKQFFRSLDELDVDLTNVEFINISVSHGISDWRREEKRINIKQLIPNYKIRARFIKAAYLALFMDFNLQLPYGRRSDIAEIRMRRSPWTKDKLIYEFKDDLKIKENVAPAKIAFNTTFTFGDLMSYIS